MAQDTSLIHCFEGAVIQSFTVGGVDIVEHRLYKQDTDGTLIIAGDNADVTLWYPLKGAKAGENVTAALVGTFAAPFTASGTISANGKVTPAASGKVRASTTGDVVIGRLFRDDGGAAGDGELANIVTSASGTGAATNTLSDSHGGSVALVVNSEEITLDTGGTTTDSSANLLPANSEILGVTAYVTTTITTAANWKVGDATTAARFVDTNTGLTAGSTAIGLMHREGGISTDATGPVQSAAAKVRITTNANPGAGKIRVVVYARTFSAPTA